MTIFSTINESYIRLKLAVSDTWAGAELHPDDIPCIVRFRPDNPLGIHQSDYNILIAINCHYFAGAYNGMPSGLDHEKMIKIEGRLKKLEYKKCAFLMAAALCNGILKWLWYSRNEEEALEIIKMVLLDFPDFHIDIETKEEPHWDTFYNNVPYQWLEEYRTKAST